MTESISDLEMELRKKYPINPQYITIMIPNYSKKEYELNVTKLAGLFREYGLKWEYETGYFAISYTTHLIPKWEANIQQRGDDLSVFLERIDYIYALNAAQKNIKKIKRKFKNSICLPPLSLENAIQFMDTLKSFTSKEVWTAIKSIKSFRRRYPKFREDTNPIPQPSLFEKRSYYQKDETDAYLAYDADTERYGEFKKYEIKVPLSKMNMLKPLTFRQIREELYEILRSIKIEDGEDEISIKDETSIKIKDGDIIFNFEVYEKEYEKMMDKIEFELRDLVKKSLWCGNFPSLDATIKFFELLKNYSRISIAI